MNNLIIMEVPSISPKKRKTAIEIVDAIYDALRTRDHVDPVMTIANRAGLDWKTVDRYLDLIGHIEGKQSGDWLIKIKSGGGFRYHRKHAPGGGRKRKES